MKNFEEADIIRLSVVDDHPVVFLGIQMALRKFKNSPIQLVNQYANGNEVIKNIGDLNSDVFLIDLFLPDIKGDDLTRKILELYPAMKIGIYSSMLDKEYILNSFRSGALGYLPKSASPDEILDFILTISKGERYIRGIIADNLFGTQNLAGEFAKMTKRETEIIELVLNGMKNREISVELNIAERTVEFHKQNIYLKLGVNNSVDLYKAAQRLNLISN